VHYLAYFADMSAMIIGVALIFWLAKKGALPNGLRPGRDLPVWVFALGASVLAAFVFLNFKLSCPPDAWDFTHAYYLAGEAVLHHDPVALHGLIGRGATGFVNIPAFAYLLTPFALFPPSTATLLLTIIGTGLTIFAWYMLVRLVRLELRERWLLAWLFLINGPLIHAIKLGNLSYFILAILVGGLVLLRGGRPLSAGALLGLAAVIKPPLALFGFFFLFRRDWRGLLGFASVGIATVLLSLALFGWSDNLYWFQTAIVQYSHSWLAAFNVQSVPAFILRLNNDARLNDWLNSQLPTTEQKLVAQIVTGLILFVALAACFRVTPKTSAQNDGAASERQDLQYLLVICLCLVSSPLTWSHYYLWLLMPTAFFLAGRVPALSTLPARWVGWAAIALVAPIIDLPWSFSNPFLMTMYRSIFLSHLLFGGLLWFGLIAWGLSRSGDFLSLSGRSSRLDVLKGLGDR
jgi:alpha-1,2-mannosyltransferase